MGKLTLSPGPSVQAYNRNIGVSATSDVREISYTDDDIEPNLSRVLVYDTNTPKKPIAVLCENGTGKLVLDGGSIKVMNDNNPNMETYTTFERMSGNLQYVANIIDYIANPSKVAAGNRNVLLFSDTKSGDKYNISDRRGTDSDITFETLCSVMGWELTKYDLDGFDDGLLNFGPNYLDNFCCAIYLALSRTERKYNRPQSSYKKITERCIDNLVDFRNNGNGLLVMTDHGKHFQNFEDVNVAETDISFCISANYLVTRFGLWFDGEVDRDMTTAGELKTSSGNPNHPIWKNMINSEGMSGALNEGTIRIRDPIYTSNNLPTIPLNKSGYITYNFIIKTSSNTYTKESYTYGLRVDPIRFKNKLNTIITRIDTVFNNVDIFFDILPGNIGMEMSGLIKHNGTTIGTTRHNGTRQYNTWYANTNNISLRKGDTFVVQLTAPLSYTKNLTLNRFQPDINKELDLSRFISQINYYEWRQSGILTTEFLTDSLKKIQQPVSRDVSANVKLLKQYINDEL